MHGSVCIDLSLCTCVCARVRACICVCFSVCVYLSGWDFLRPHKGQILVPDEKHSISSNEHPSHLKQSEILQKAQRERLHPAVYTDHICAFPETSRSLSPIYVHTFCLQCHSLHILAATNFCLSHRTMTDYLVSPSSKQEDCLLLGSKTARAQSSGPEPGTVQYIYT